jgi:hypothetical protein
LTQDEHVRPVPIIEVAINSCAAHTKATKKVVHALKTAGKYIGGGIGLLASFFTAGIGWILGTGITLGAAKIGEVPGVLVDKIDTFLTDNALEKYTGDIQAIIGLFAGRMIEIPKFDTDALDVARFCNTYSRDHQKYFGHIRHEKKKLSFPFNGISKGKNTVKFYRTVNCEEASLIIELKKKTVEHAEITVNENVLLEMFCEYCSKYYGSNYESLMEKKGFATIQQTHEELVAELRKKFTAG